MKIMTLALVAFLSVNVASAEEIDPLAPWDAEAATRATGLALQSLGEKLVKSAGELEGVSLESLKNEMNISLSSGKNSLRAKATSTVTNADGEQTVVSVRSFCHVHQHSEPAVAGEGEHEGEGEEEGEGEHEHEHEGEGEHAELPIDCH